MITKNPMDVLTTWEHRLPEGVTIRGWRNLPSGKPVIHFLHGTGFCGLSYWPMLSCLLDRYDLFIHDIQGHGDSDLGESFWGWNENAEQVCRVWEAFEAEYAEVPVIGMGHSFGAILTALIAGKKPGLFQQVVLLDPVLFSRFILAFMHVYRFFRIGTPNPYASKAKRRRNFWNSREEAKEYFYERGAFKGWHDLALQSYVDYALREQSDGAFILKCPPIREAEVFGSFPLRLWDTVKRINVPTQVIYGQTSYPFVVKSTRRLTRLNKMVNSEVVSGGHCFMQENPRDIANLLLEKMN